MKDHFKKVEKYFVGLWKYQCYSTNLKAKKPSYLLTICIKGQHIDTHCHKNPINAFKEAIRIIGKLK